MRVDDVLKRMAARVRRSEMRMSDSALERLVVDLFLDAARFTIEWEACVAGEADPTPRSLSGGDVYHDISRGTHRTS